jgi:hypothetical protein
VRKPDKGEISVQQLAKGFTLNSDEENGAQSGVPWVHLYQAASNLSADSAGPTKPPNSIAKYMLLFKSGLTHEQSFDFISIMFACLEGRARDKLGDMRTRRGFDILGQTFGRSQDYQLLDKLQVGKQLFGWTNVFQHYSEKPVRSPLEDKPMKETGEHIERLWESTCVVRSK